MAFITIVESKSNTHNRCSCCGEAIRHGMKYSRIESTKYCHTADCHTRYLPMNHNVEVIEVEDLENKAEREREIFASYKASGLSANAYWNDKEWEGR